ncbi:hypothetical protein BJY00DRAFT_293738 [Aspergillus carlsbadensis]|nr:hypothetical protein BJY00DRAFT_293738 [Aspergillus carlsbadensis]
MKPSAVCLALLIAGAHGLDRIAPRPVSTEPHTSDDGDQTRLIPLINHDGWANPEDFLPMPQCIAQQDQGAWLSAMTGCTKKRCTSHFPFICTHHQWLTERSCLSTAFSTDFIRTYYKYCDRSILAKAQLYQWVRGITGRTWLVDVGDTNELQDLSPASLADGYAALDVIEKAPTCLTGSDSAPSREPFQHVMASCGFTSTSQHTGNAARPWEYNEHLRSMTTLDSETVGYDLTRGRIADGDYFDRKCFCGTFTLNLEEEPCAGGTALDLTKERLWINAICGSASLPKTWKEGLKTTEHAYIPVEAWHWPRCVADIPEQVIKLPDQCATDACEVDSQGYCNVKRAVDRACFCRSISYNSCKGSCHVFEDRINYVEWLHGLCGDVQDWHGLPDDWRELAAPTPPDMIPWQWTLRPYNGSDTGNSESHDAVGSCPSNEWKLGSIALVNIVTFHAALLTQIKGPGRATGGHQEQRHPSSWVFKGYAIASVQLVANALNSLLIQNTPGYENIPVIQLILLWCSMPRPVWWAILLTGLQPLGATQLSGAASPLFAEIILQALSSYYLFMTFYYGREHKFYFGRLNSAERAIEGKMMYAGALMWLVTVILALVHLTRAIRRMNRLAKFRDMDPSYPRKSQAAAANNAEDLTGLFYDRWAKMTVDFSGLDTPRDSEEALLGNSRTEHNSAYGTFSGQRRRTGVSPQTFPYLGIVIFMFLFWIAQWLFWAGFIGLSSERFCPPRLEVLTAVWVVSSALALIMSNF